MSEVEEACGEQDWDRAMAISQQILEMQREAGERPPEMMIMPDDSEEVQEVMKHIEEEEEDFEHEMVVSLLCGLRVMSVYSCIWHLCCVRLS